MSRRSTPILKAGLAALRLSRADDLVSRLAPVSGAILTLHQVSPEPAPTFSPNRILRITPDFLDRTIRHVLEAGFEILSMDEVASRIRDPKAARPFVAFTLDDGYRDNLVHAWPVFRRHGVPFTVYVPTDYPDGRGELWWLALEEVLRHVSSLTVPMHGRARTFSCPTDAAREIAFHEIYWWLRGLDETEARSLVARWCAEAGVDTAAHCRSLIMTWDEIRRLARDPLATIGAHTVRHMAVARQTSDAVRAEMAQSRDRIAAETGRACRHFSYPYGDAGSAGARDFEIARAIGFATAVTTRKALIQTHARPDPMALPRLSLNGDYQDLRHLKVLLTGAPFALLDAARRVRGIAASA